MLFIHVYNHLVSVIGLPVFFVEYIPVYRYRNSIPQATQIQTLYPSPGGGPTPAAAQPQIHIPYISKQDTYTGQDI